MAYQTGIAASHTALLSALITFASAHGWTHTTAGGKDILNNVNGYVRLGTFDDPTPGVVPDTEYQGTGISLEGCNDNTFAGSGLCGGTARMAIDPWPTSVVYHFFAFNSPDMIWVTLRYGLTLHQYLVFGDITKTSNTAGGNFFAASHGANGRGGWQKNAYFSMNSMRSGSAVANTQQTPSAVMFWGAVSASDNWGDVPYIDNRAAYLHIELDGHIWPGDRAPDHSVHPTVTDAANPLHTRMVSSVADELVMVPYWLAIQRPDGYWSDIGYIDNLRIAWLENYAAGDVVTIGTEKWKLFPWYAIDPTNPNGGGSNTNGPGDTYGNGSSGFWGYALKYDGP